MSVTLHTTHGPLKIEIFCEAVPATAENFLALCASGAYTGTPIHRIHAGFIAQGGDISLSPTLNTTSSTTILPHIPRPIPKGGVPITYPEQLPDEIKLPSLSHSARGIVAMANKGPGTAGSQFYILFAPQTQLDGANTVFGRVIGEEGMATLEEMEKVRVDRKGRVLEKEGEKRVVVERVEIHANPLAR